MSAQKGPGIELGSVSFHVRRPADARREMLRRAATSRALRHRAPQPEEHLWTGELRTPGTAEGSTWPSDVLAVKSTTKALSRRYLPFKDRLESAHHGSSRAELQRMLTETAPKGKGSVYSVPIAKLAEHLGVPGLDVCTGLTPAQVEASRAAHGMLY